MEQTPNGKHKFEPVINLPLKDKYRYLIKCSCGFEARVNWEPEIQQVKDNHTVKHMNDF